MWRKIDFSLFSLCRFGECSQICNIKKDRNHTCSCAPGYSLHSWSQKNQKSCFADGNLAYMILANDNHLRKLSPYKHGNSASILTLTEVQTYPFVNLNMKFPSCVQDNCENWMLIAILYCVCNLMGMLLICICRRIQRLWKSTVLMSCMVTLPSPSGQIFMIIRWCLWLFQPLMTRIIRGQEERQLRSQLWWVLKTCGFTFMITFVV